MLDQLTPLEKRSIRDNYPALSDRPPGIDLAAKLDEIIAAINDSEAALTKIRSGTATIVATEDDVTIAVGAAFNGKPAVVSIMQAAADATLTAIETIAWDGSGNLTVTGNAAATANTTIAWMVDGR